MKTEFDKWRGGYSLEQRQVYSIFSERQIKTKINMALGSDMEASLDDMGSTC
jgi:hypothetical protein